MFLYLSKSTDAINTCIKGSVLYQNGTIQSRFLNINERVRQFGGHPTYARFLMYLGLGLLRRKRKDLYFRWNTQDYVALPSEIEGHRIIKDFKGKYFDSYPFIFFV